MEQSLKFGTSGLRGLATELSGAAARRYTMAFLTHLHDTGARFGQVFLARDFRASSAAIADDCAAAIRAAGFVPVDCGPLPTPALALHAMAAGAPAIMVTGSHIPADRNGLKFYRPEGEITKADEAGILAALRDGPPPAAAADPVDGFAAAGDRYRQRYRHFLRSGELAGWRIGVFEHSSVARDHLASLLHRAGATVIRLGRSDTFVPVDTEAFDDDIYAPRHGWIADHALDAIVSTDADADRPLLCDASGNFVRGDALGLLAAMLLKADTVVTPVTSNSAIERCGAFANVVRTKVGSPFVIAGIEAALAQPGTVVGFEANGGTLLGSDAVLDGRPLSRLPTRDALLPILAVLATAARQGKTVAEIVAALPLRPALAGRLQDVPVERAQALLTRLATEPAYATAFFSGIGEVGELTTIDGPRVEFATGDIIHYRASGNAPELRCFIESETLVRAQMLLRWGLDAAAAVVRG